MSKNVTLGGDRLGSGNKMKVQMHNYERSNHDLSYVWRSTMAPGVLVPFMNEIGLPGDSFDIDLETLAKTLPTVGPLLGSFKLQLDVFQAPIRLYHSALHNNMLGIGLEMDKIKLPKIHFNKPITNAYAIEFDKLKGQTPETGTSSLLAYLGLRNIGQGVSNASATATETYDTYFNATSIFAYYDIFKNYYANKQEENAYYITSQRRCKGEIEKLWVFCTKSEATKVLGGEEWDDYYSTPSPEYEGIDLYRSPQLLNNRPYYDMLINSQTEELAIKVVIRFINDTFIKDEAKFNIFATFIMFGVSRIDQTAVAYEKSLIGVINQGGTYTVGEDGRTIIVDLTFWNDPDHYQAGDCLTRVKLLTQNLIENNTLNIDRKDWFYDELVLKSFPLKNLDDAREQILWSSKYEEVVIEPSTSYTGVNMPPYSANAGTSSLFRGDLTMRGLLVKTYQSDIFNNWLNSETIDGDNGINEITKIDTSDGLKIESLIIQKKVYNMLNRIAVSGGTYKDWLSAVYSEESYWQTENPIYCGGLSKEIAFEEITSTAGDASNPLGTLAGRGTLTSKHKGGHIKVKCNEPSIIMGIVSITPRLDYSQGNKWSVDLDSMANLHAPALDAIGFQDLTGNLMDGMSTIQNLIVSSVKTRIDYKVGKQPAWINYMTNVNQCYGHFAEKDSQMYMTLNRQYERKLVCSNEGLPLPALKTRYVNTDFTTYIDPVKFNYAFAETDLKAQNFWIQIGVNIKARRKISAKQIPNL